MYVDIKKGVMGGGDSPSGLNRVVAIKAPKKKEGDKIMGP